MKDLAAVILAGGQGSRMKSDKPKVLHQLLGLSLLDRVLKNLTQAGISECALVLPREYSPFEPLLKEYPQLMAVSQLEPKGTGDALAAALGCFEQAKPPFYAKYNLLKAQRTKASYVLVTYGDTPNISAERLDSFIKAAYKSGAKLSLCAMRVKAPKGYGRLLKDQNGILKAIVEEKDATPEEAKIDLINTGLYLFEVSFISKLLNEIGPKNAQGEYYLTDSIKLAYQKAEQSFVYEIPESSEFQGINDLLQLAEAEAYLLQETRKKLLLKGVRLIQPDTIYCEDQVEIERGCVIEPHCYLAGPTSIGEHSHIGSHCIIRGAKLLPRTDLSPFSILEPS